MMMFGMPAYMEMLMMLSMMGGAGIPLGVPPAEEDRLMSLVAPQECLYYTTWAGTQAPDPSSENHTEKLFAEKEVQDFIKSLENTIVTSLKRMGEGAPPERAVMSELLPKWGKTLLTNATCIYVSRFQIGPQGPDIDAGLIIHAGKEKATELAASLEFFTKGQAKEVEIDGATYKQFQPSPKSPVITFGVRGRYFVAAFGKDSLKSMFDNVRRNAKQGLPKWLDQLRKRWQVDRVSTVSYANLGTIVDVVSVAGGPEANQVFRAIGVGNLKTYEAVTGLDKTGFVNHTFLGVEGKATGLLACIDGKPISAAELSKIPQDTPVAIALRVDGVKLFDGFLDMIEMIEPRGREEVEREMGEAEEVLGFKIRDDLISSLGDLVYVYAAPNDGGLITGWTGVVSVRDYESLTKVNKTLITFMRAMFQQEPRAPKLNEVKVGEHTIYVLSVPDDDVPVAPSWCLTENEVIFGLFPQAVKAHLTRGAGMKSFADRDDVANLVKGDSGAIALAYFDTRKLFNILYPMAQMGLTAVAGEMRREGFEFDAAMLPSTASISKHLQPTLAVARRSMTGIEATAHQTLPGGNLGASAPILVAALLPAIASARGAARRMESTNNLRQIALAMHNYHDTFRRLPPAYSIDKDGKPLLSWRVYILPYIEQQRLFEEFHLDEPWDSEHNKKLLARMPRTYRSPGSNVGPGMTTYQGVRGKNTILAPPADDQKGNTKQPVGIGFQHVFDGTSNTILAVETNDSVAVPWTKPDDFTPDDMNPFKSLHGPFGQGFLAAMTDGSVQFLQGKLDMKLLNNLFQRDDGNAVRIPRQERTLRGGFGGFDIIEEEKIDIAPDSGEGDFKDDAPRDAPRIRRKEEADGEELPRPADGGFKRGAPFERPPIRAKDPVERAKSPRPVDSGAKDSGVFDLRP